jgi:hypothetical protein
MANLMVYKYLTQLFKGVMADVLKVKPPEKKPMERR